MTDVESGGEAKFGVSASTNFVGATQALISLTPNKSGSAAFLAVADTEIIPSATAATALLAYREIDFSGTSPQIIQFALSISAIQNSTSGEVSGTTTAILQPGTAYKIVMYHSGNSTILRTFTTLGHLEEGYALAKPASDYIFDMSAHNFQTETDGKFRVPFVFPWVVNSGFTSEVLNKGGDETAVDNRIGSIDPSNIRIETNYNTLVNAFGDGTLGAVFLHTPRSGAVRKYALSFINNIGQGLTITYN
ncbi:hypothetical protein P0082_02360 [Candidatus Haliotispira prima]|uniref:Uncharacterized protein n=1 Tax=Candidatus Haliotispira prima TaxID=3034016 RepID=A0ABY8MI92_9SPIO|nr:hypothetical protein P0082_02360 [Candidatus Haliotispira prima]